jgi:hypothetical protein
MRGSQQRRVREFGAPAASLIIEDDYAVLGERLEVRTAVIDACAWPTVDHNHRVVAGSGHFVEDLGTTRTGQITLGRYSWCGLVPATNRHRDENAEQEDSKTIRRRRTVWRLPFLSLRHWGYAIPS